MIWKRLRASDSSASFGSGDGPTDSAANGCVQGGDANCSAAAARPEDELYSALPGLLGGSWKGRKSKEVAEVAASALRSCATAASAARAAKAELASRRSCGCCCTPSCKDARERAVASMVPNHYQLGVASYYAGVKNSRRRKATVPGGIPLTEICAVEDRVTGLRVLLFTGPEHTMPACTCTHSQECRNAGQPLPTADGRASVAVLAFRGTRATHRGNLAADLGILRHNTRQAELRIAEEARAVVEGFTAQLEATAPPGLRYVWVATGHSLGGFLATTIAIRMPHIHTCVCFESPGVPKLYRDLAAKRFYVAAASSSPSDPYAPSSTSEYWNRRVTNYLTLPNPVNMSHPHVGRVVRVEIDLLSSNGLGHIIKCLAGSLFRWINWLCALVVLFMASEILLGLSLSAALIHVCEALEALQTFALGASTSALLGPGLCLVGLGEAVTLWHVVTAASLSAKGTTALVATRLGANVPFQLAAHKLTNILRAFDTETGVPKDGVEMASWPCMVCFKRSVTKDLMLYLYECFFATETTESVRHIFNRRDLLSNRISALPGYMELRIDEGSEVLAEVMDGEEGDTRTTRTARASYAGTGSPWEQITAEAAAGTDYDSDSSVAVPASPLGKAARWAVWKSWRHGSALPSGSRPLVSASPSM